MYLPLSQRLPGVIASMSYLSRTEERPFQYAYPPPDGQPWESADYDIRATFIADARRTEGSVHDCGFVLCDAPTGVRDFEDKDELARVYYPEVASLALAATGATRAYVFDHLVRKREADRRALSFGRSSRGQPAAANGRIHNDYTEQSGQRRLGLVIGEDAAMANGSRYAIVNVWRSIRGPVLDTPLAVCDARTVDASELVVADVHYPKRKGEIYMLRHGHRHRWSYFSGMDRHEALVFKQYDSQVSGVARYTPHAAFELPDVPAGTPLRESIEARCLVIFD
ncbi:CmcJ/NvfI family oxidoreductase [Rothia nasimurium]